MEGKLYWLPEEKIIVEKHGSLSLLQRPDSFKGTFGHPFLVVKYDRETNQVSGYCCTSFGNKPIQHRQKKPEFRVGYMAMVPSSPHPDTGVLLRITDENFTFRKRNSYVNVRFLRTLHLSVLEEFWDGEQVLGAEHVLDATSMKALRAGAKYARKVGYGTKNSLPSRVVSGTITSYSAAVAASAEQPTATGEILAHESTVPTTSTTTYIDADTAERGQVHHPRPAEALDEEGGGEGDGTPLLAPVSPGAPIPSLPDSVFEKFVVPLLTVAAVAGAFGLCVLVWQIWP